MPKPIIYITVILLIIATLPLLYGYYTLLRIIVTAVFTWAAYITYERHHKILPWLLMAIAILFNPLIKIYLSKSIWIIVDISVAVILLLLINKIKVLQTGDSIKHSKISK